MVLFSWLDRGDGLWSVDSEGKVPVSVSKPGAQNLMTVAVTDRQVIPCLQEGAVSDRLFVISSFI